MPRQRIHHSRVTYEVPGDFPERLERFKEESGLSWAEIARRLDVHHETLRRWREKDVLPNTRNDAALLQVADSLGREGLQRLIERLPEAVEAYREVQQLHRHRRMNRSLKQHPLGLPISFKGAPQGRSGLGAPSTARGSQAGAFRFLRKTLKVSKKFPARLTLQRGGKARRV